MKISLLCCRILSTIILAFLFSSVAIAQTANTTQAINNTHEIRPLNANTSEMMPFDFPNFEIWAKGQNNSVIWLYLFDENYRTLANNWNTINNPFWAAAITGSCPYGTFDFTMGLSKVNFVENYGSLEEHLRNNYNLNPIKPTNIFGLPSFASKVQSPNNTDNEAGIKSLPPKNPKTTTVNQHVVKQVDFTQHITPVATSWSQNKGMNKRNRAMSSGIQTYINSNQSLYAAGINGSTGTTTSNGTNATSSNYSNYSSGKGGSGPSAVVSSSPSKTASTGRAPSSTTSSN